MKSVSLVSYIVTSILLGFSMYILPGIIFCSLLTMLLFILMIRSTDTVDRKFVFAVMGMALVLRLLAIIFVQSYCFSRGITDIFGDASDNIEQGKNVVIYLKEGNDTLKKWFFEPTSYNIHGKTFFNGLFFITFGKDLISLKFLNSLCIVLLSWQIYDLTRKIYSSAAGKIAMSIILFWPTLFLWSITDLKESHLFLSVISLFWVLNNLIKATEIKSRLFYSILAIISAYYAISIRGRILLPLILVILPVISGYYLFLWCLGKNYKPVRRPILFTLTAGIFLLISYRLPILQTFKTYYEATIGYQISFLNSGGWNYNLIGDTQNYYTISFFFKYLSGAWYHFLFEPLPWHIFSKSMLAAYPMTIVWYSMLIFSLIGVIKLYRIGKIKEIIPSLIFVVLYITSVGMSVPNIGTMVRFRDTIMPFIAIFASCGFVRTLKPLR